MNEWMNESMNEWMNKLKKKWNSYFCRRKIDQRNNFYSLWQSASLNDCSQNCIFPFKYNNRMFRFVLDRIFKNCFTLHFSNDLYAFEIFNGTSQSKDLCTLWNISYMTNATFERSLSQILQNNLQARYLKDILEEL